MPGEDTEESDDDEKRNKSMSDNVCEEQQEK
jgi:hypothetical protein